VDVGKVFIVLLVLIELLHSQEGEQGDKAMILHRYTVITGWIVAGITSIKLRNNHVSGCLGHVCVGCLYNQ
jgi:hypothetical protein